MVSIKALRNINPINMSEDQKRALLYPGMIGVEPYRKKYPSFLFLAARTQAMKYPGLSFYSSPNFLFISAKVFSFPCPAGLARDSPWLQGLPRWFSSKEST